MEITGTKFIFSNLIADAESYNEIKNQFLKFYHTNLHEQLENHLINNKLLSPPSNESTWCSKI